MGFFEQAQFPNPATIGETTSTIIFPAESSIQSEIPLFIRFVCVEYSMNGIARSGIKNLASLPKANIYVPVPSKLVTQTAMRYKQEANEEYMKLQDQKDFEAKLPQWSAALGAKAAAAAAGMFPRFGGLAGMYGKNFTNSLGQLLDTDFTETILQSGSKRSFTISLYLPCLNLDDSKAAAKITRAFEALSLPSMLGIGVSGVGGVQMHFHPPMWFFGIGPLKSVNSDVDWTSQPQASVLTNVAVSRTAIDAASFTALDNVTKPVAYSITLNFQEIEGAFRVPNIAQETSFGIKNRSGALLSGGAAAIGVLSPLG